MERISRDVKEELRRLINIAGSFGLEEEAAKPRHRLEDLEFGALAMIVGEGNFGKSSLINALADRTIASTNVLPATTKVDIFTAARDGQPQARIRRIAQNGWQHLDIETARHICLAEEERVRSGGEPELSDAVWEFPDTKIPKGLCLVDTPGIAQDLLGTITARSIVDGLDIVYTVEDVWAYWIHRADIVLWVFEANRIESAETYRALERFLSVYDKPILPIATKIDRVAPDRAAEVTNHFARAFGDLLKTRRCDPLRRVCCAPGEARYGEGIEELRQRLYQLAAEALAIKETANREFIEQQAALLDRELRTMGEMIVGNLRTIALVGDECALIFEEEYARMEETLFQDLTSYCRSRCEHLDERLPYLWHQWEELAKRRDEGTAKRQAERDLRSIVDEAAIESLIEERGAQAAESIARRCKIQSERWPIKSVKIHASGEVTESSRSLKMHVPPVKVEAAVKIPRPEFSGCVLPIAVTAAAILSAMWSLLGG
jgi:GTP-binding protein EngB required for normal cell division